MSRTTIPWGDGSGGNIYLDYPAPSGDQEILVSSDANFGSPRTKAITFSAAGVSPVVLTVGQPAMALPDTYQELDGIVFDGNVWYDTGMRLYGSDTLKFSFLVSKACNVIGCYTSASAQTNFSLYVSTTSSGKYTRYNGGTYSSYVATNTRYDVTLSPTGTSGMRVNSTWTEKEFTSESDMLIGSTSVGATSAKLTGVMYGRVEVVGRAMFVPCVRLSDGAIGYYNLYNDTFSANEGTGTPGKWVDGLPVGATAYDWLRSDGTQYIDTGIGNGKTTAQVRIETVTAFLSGTPQYSWSVWASTDAGNMGVQYASSSRISIVGGATQYTQQSNPTYRKEITINYPTMTVVSPYTTTATRAMASATYTADILLLANTGGSRIAKGGIRRTKIWVDDVLVRDYLPCTDPNGRAAVYDLVNGTYNYGANATGNDFTVAND